MWTLLVVGCLRPDVDRILTERRADRPESIPDQVWADGLTAWGCAVDGGRTWSTSLGIADFSQASDKRRLSIVDLETGDVLVHDRVAHGSGSGGRFATKFSAEEGSHATSLGTYRGGIPFRGKKGRSLLLDGLEPSNATARRREVIVHPSKYVDDEWVAEHGRAGRSWGCFAVDPDLADPVVDGLQGGILVAWADDNVWRGSSPYLNCGLEVDASAGAE